MGRYAAGRVDRLRAGAVDSLGARDRHEEGTHLADLTHHADPPSPAWQVWAAGLAVAVVLGSTLLAVVLVLIAYAGAGP